MAIAAREHVLERRWEQSLEPLYRAYRDAHDATVSATARAVVPLSAGN
jgi:hypothetical protein